MWLIYIATNDKFEGADKLLSSIKVDAGSQKAKIFDLRGDLAMLALKYTTAAEFYQDASASISPEEDIQAWVDYRNKQYDALYAQGIDFDDEPALRQALDLALSTWEQVLLDSSPELEESSFKNLKEVTARLHDLAWENL